jgi:hypothetical protein
MNRLLAFIGPLLCLCGAACTSKEPQCEAGYAVMGAYIKKMHKEKKWDLLGIGGSFQEKIRMLALDFNSYDQRVTLEEARQILVETAEDFVAFINSNQRIQPYLEDLPATYRNIKLGICFYDTRKQEFISDGHIAHVFLIGDVKSPVVCYSIHDEAEDRLKGIHHESYVKAREIVQAIKDAPPPDHDLVKDTIPNSLLKLSHEDLPAPKPS